MANKLIKYTEMRTAAILVNSMILSGKLTIGEHGNVEASRDFYKSLTTTKAEGAKALIEALTTGREMFAARAAKEGKAKAPAAPAAPAAETPAAPAAPAEKAERKGPKFNYEVCLATLAKAQTLVQEGKDLSSLTDEEKALVEIKPATRPKRVFVDDGKGGSVATLAKDEAGVLLTEPNPYAGRVGFTTPVVNSLQGTMRTYTKVLANPSKLTKEEVDKLTTILGQAEETYKAGGASLGIKTEAEKAKEVEQAAPAPEVALTPEG